MVGKTHPRSGEASSSDTPETAPPPERVEEGQTAAEQSPQNRGIPAWQPVALQAGLSPVQELRRIREALEAAGGARPHPGNSVSGGGQREIGQISDAAAAALERRDPDCMAEMDRIKELAGETRGENGYGQGFGPRGPRGEPISPAERIRRMRDSLPPSGRLGPGEHQHLGHLDPETIDALMRGDAEATQALQELLGNSGNAAGMPVQSWIMPEDKAPTLDEMVEVMAKGPNAEMQLIPIPSEAVEQDPENLQLTPGSVVKIHSLQSAAAQKHNGAHAELGLYNAATRRWQAKLKRGRTLSGVEINVKSSNLTFVRAPPEPPPLDIGTQQRQALDRLTQLSRATNWKAIAMDCYVFRNLAESLRDSEPAVAACVYGHLAHCFGYGLGLMVESIALLQMCKACWESGRALGAGPGQLRLMSGELLALSARTQVGSACINMGICYQGLKQHDKAEALFESARAMAQEEGYRRAEGVAGRHLGSMLQALGRHAEAIEHLQHCYGLAQQLGDVARACADALMLASCHSAFGRSESALGWYQRAEELARSGHPTFSTGGVGVRASRLGFATLSAPSALSEALCGAGACCLALGDFAEALRVLQLQWGMMQGDMLLASNGQARCALSMGVAHWLRARFPGASAAGCGGGGASGEEEYIEPEIGTGRTKEWTERAMSIASLASFANQVGARPVIPQPPLSPGAAAGSTAAGEGEEEGREEECNVLECGEADDSDDSDEELGAGGASGEGTEAGHTRMVADTGALDDAGTHTTALASARKWLAAAVQLGEVDNFPKLAQDARLYQACIMFFEGEREGAIAALQHVVDDMCRWGNHHCGGCELHKDAFFRGMVRVQEEMREHSGGDALPEFQAVCGECVGLLDDKATIMSKCGGCGVSRFCNQEHQKIAFRGVLFPGCASRHKLVCPLLRKWRDRSKGRISEDECRTAFVNYLRRCCQLGGKVPGGGAAGGARVVGQAT